MYPDGDAMTQKLVEQWKQIYKRRTALLDKLKKRLFVTEKAYHFDLQAC